MKVLFITNYDTMYGANRCLFELAVSLKTQHDVEPYVLVPNGGKIGDALQPYGIDCLCNEFRIYALNENIRYKKIRKLTRRIMRYVDYYRILWDIRKKGLSFDLVHTNTSITDLGYFLSKRWKVPHIWHVREFGKEDYGLECVLRKKEVEKRYQSTDCMIAISGAIQDKLEHMGEDIPIVRIYDGIRIRTPYQKEYISDGVLKFCIVGSMFQGKRQLDVLKACRQLREMGYHAFEINIVGNTGGDYYRLLEEYIRKYQLNEYIRFPGYVENINTFLEHMDVGIMASSQEAFGRVTIEYMANYMMVIGTNSGGTPELIEETGLLYPVSDIDKLVQCMITCLEDRAMVMKKGNLSRMQAEKFTLEKNVDSIYQIYKTTIENNKER